MSVANAPHGRIAERPVQIAIKASIDLINLLVVRPCSYDKQPMVSALHEDMLQLVRDHPAFVAELLGNVLRIDMPGFREARLADSALNQVVPVEHRADAVVLFTEDKPVFGAIIEAQLQRDEDKLFTWPLYAVTARERHRCPFIVIVVTPDRPTATWAARRIDLGGGVHYWPAVIGPDAIPKIMDRDQARREPYLAVLSVLAHGQSDLETAGAIGSAAAWAVLPFPKDKRTVYSRMIEAHLSEAARKAIEMQPGLKTFFSEAQRDNDERVRAEGEAKGRAEGKAEGAITALLKILTQRRLTLTAEQRRRVLACTDLATLDQWLDRSLTVGSVDELFAP